MDLNQLIRSLELIVYLCLSSCLKPDEALILLYLLYALDKYNSGHCSTLHCCEDVEELDKKARSAVCEEPVDWCQEAWVDAVYDDIYGRELDPDGVAKARGEELEFIDKMGV